MLRDKTTRGKTRHEVSPFGDEILTGSYEDFNSFTQPTETLRSDK